jgi:predicted enzyme related to lactoylglutathione lyase
MPPDSTNGKICYVEIPALDIARSSDFYDKVFNWSLKKRGDGSTAFDDTTGQVSGTWVLGRPVSSEPGLLLYIMVDDMAVTLQAVTEHGGEVVQTVDATAPEFIAKFRDPAGNVIGLYQEPGK